MRSLKLVLFRALLIDHHRLPRGHLRLMLLFFNLFMFFNLNFLRGNMKTEKCTVDTEEVVDSTAKLLGTSKVLSIDGVEMDLFRLAPEGSFLKKLSGKNIFEINSKQME